MSLRLAYGDGEDCNFTPLTAISGTTPIVSRVIDMRNFDDVSLQLISSGGSLVWLIEASNDFVAATNGTAYGSISNGTSPVGTFTDITAMFTVPAGTAIVNPSGAALAQFVMPKTRLRCRALRITATPSAGSGNVSVLGNCSCWGG